MGDLAFCQLWERDIGRETTEFGYVLSRSQAPQIDPRDRCYFFDPSRHVRETIREAAEAFRPDAIFFGTNSFWNIAGQKGAELGFFDDTLRELRIPLMSLDAYEERRLANTPWRPDILEFEAVPPYVWSLRMLSSEAHVDAGNVRHFRMEEVIAPETLVPDPELFQRLGIAEAPHYMLFPVSVDRFVAIREIYYDYYAYLAKVFGGVAAEGIHMVVISPAPVPEFAELPNVSQIRFVTFLDFIRLILRCGALLTDSIISSILHCVHTSTPALAMVNSHDRLETLPQHSRELLRVGWLHEERNWPWDAMRSPVNRFYLGERLLPSMVFPFGLTEMVQVMARRFEVEGTFAMVEMFDYDALQARIVEVATNPQVRAGLIARCDHWRAVRKNFPRPREVFEDILRQPLLY